MTALAVLATAPPPPPSAAHWASLEPSPLPQAEQTASLALEIGLAPLP